MILSFNALAVHWIELKIGELIKVLMGWHLDATAKSGSGTERTTLLLSVKHAEFGETKITFEEAKREVLDHLNCFKGFSGMEYFYVNKEMLTSIFSSGVTYLIILMQFRFSEVAKGTNQT